MTSDHNKLLCLHILGFKKPGISLQEYRDYMINVHAPLVAGLMEKYGFLRWSMVSGQTNTAADFWGDKRAS